MRIKKTHFSLYLLAVMSACSANEPTRERMSDVEYHRSAFYSRFGVDEQLAVTETDHSIAYRFFLHQNGIYEVVVSIDIDARIPKSGLSRYYEYDETAQTSATLTVREQTSAGLVVILGKATVSYRDERIFSLLTFLGQNEVFSLPPEFAALDPQHLSFGKLGSDGTVYAERRDSRSVRILYRNIYKAEDGVAERLAAKLHTIIGSMIRSDR
jgi:hypothetical protein